MVKKKSKTTVSSTHYKNAKWMRLLAGIGGAVALVFHILTFFPIYNAFVTIESALYIILGIIGNIVLLGSLNLINHRFIIKMTWFSLLILGIIDAISFGLSSSSVNPGYLGTLCIIIAAVIGIIDRV